MVQIIRLPLIHRGHWASGVAWPGRLAVAGHRTWVFWASRVYTQCPLLKH